MSSLKSSLTAKTAAYLVAVISGVTGICAAAYSVMYSDVTKYLLGRIPFNADECAVAAAVCATVYLVMAVFLASSVGHRRDKADEELTPNWCTAIPFEITTTAAAFLIAVAVGLWLEGMDMYFYSRYSTYLDLCRFSFIACCTAVFMLFTGWFMDLALKIKLGRWWEKTLCWKLGIISIKLVKWLWVNLVIRLWGLCIRAICGVFSFLRGFIKKLVTAIRELITGIPLVWKGALALAVICIGELIGIVMIGVVREELLMLWILEKLLLVPLCIYLLICMKKLKIGGKALAEGNLAYHVNTEKMVLDFKEHGENLNKIAQGSAVAVDQRMKSERMKTELITNVSHDIKTPLTSIINYTDLISKEEPGSEKIAEYTEVLQRQSKRLKKLLEDLLEVSKASTGNLDVLLSPCDARTLISQTEGEYEEKLEASELKIVVNIPEEPLYIMADGRRIWRVFDNLMNNICKYSQPGTRVYVGLERVGHEAVITFRNTSKDELNITADELMDRFVRGDSSRNTEGSGLGLSIAKSFTELQHGTMELSIDGDLFKVILRFPAI